MTISLKDIQQEKKKRMIKMIFINLFPVLCLVAVCILKLVETTHIRHDAVKGRDSAENFLRLDALIQAMQYERGFAAAYLRSAGQSASLYSFGRGTTNEALDKADWPESSLFPTYVNNKEKFTEYLENVRNKVVDLQSTMPDVLANYTTMSGDLMRATERSITVPQRGQVWNMVAAAGFLLRASDPIGSLFSTARTFFFTCSYSRQDYVRYLRFEGERQVMLHQAVLLDEKLFENYTKRIANNQNIGIDLESERQLIISDQFQTECLKFPEDERRNFEFKWTQDFGQYWAEFRALRDDYVMNIVEKLDSIAYNTENEMMIYIIVVILVTLVCAALVIWQARRVYYVINDLVVSTIKSKVVASKVGDETTKSDALLYQMVPLSVAADLKSGKDVPPRYFESVTICYIDLVGFMALITKLKPVEVTLLLNELYRMFDKTMLMRGVHKIEQSNDVTCVVSGVLSENKDHVDEIASFITELLRNIEKFQATGMPDVQISCRAGVHTGPCAAGVVGHTSYRYSIFGESVKMASRMSRSSEVQRIQISSQTRDILTSKYSNKYSVEERGEIDVFGVGRVKTYFLDHRPHFKNDTDPAVSKSNYFVTKL